MLEKKNQQSNEIRYKNCRKGNEGTGEIRQQLNCDVNRNIRKTEIKVVPTKRILSGKFLANI